MSEVLPSDECELTNVRYRLVKTHGKVGDGVRLEILSADGIAGPRLMREEWVHPAHRAGLKHDGKEHTRVRLRTFRWVRDLLRTGTCRVGERFAYRKEGV